MDGSDEGPYLEVKMPERFLLQFQLENGRWMDEAICLYVAAVAEAFKASSIADVVHELAERFTILECAFDPWRAGQVAQELE